MILRCCFAMLFGGLFTAVEACGSTGGFTGNNIDGGTTGSFGGRCNDLVLFPVGPVDQQDQYRFDYSDAGFGNTHSQGSQVTITCVTNGQSATVKAFDAARASIRQGSSIVATCERSSQSQGGLSWLVPAQDGFSRKLMQFVDCDLF